MPGAHLVETTIATTIFLSMSPVMQTSMTLLPCEHDFILGACCGDVGIQIPRLPSPATQTSTDIRCIACCMSPQKQISLGNALKLNQHKPCQNGHVWVCRDCHTYTYIFFERALRCHPFT